MSSSSASGSSSSSSCPSFLDDLCFLGALPQRSKTKRSPNSNKKMPKQRQLPLQSAIPNLSTVVCVPTAFPKQKAKTAAAAATESQDNPFTPHGGMSLISSCTAKQNSGRGRYMYRSRGSKILFHVQQTVVYLHACLMVKTTDNINGLQWLEHSQASSPSQDGLHIKLTLACLHGTLPPEHSAFPILLVLYVNSRCAGLITCFG